MTLKKNVILVHETAMQSWLKDAGTFAMFASMIGLGWAIDSVVMQVIGAIVAMASISIVSIRRTVGKTYTVAEARKRLDEIEGAA